MRQELTEKLHASYPAIFPKRIGFACGDGWFDLIDQLCERLQFDIEHNKQPQIVAVEAKEKFGGLRFYVDGATDRQRGMIDFACALSHRICDQCGGPGRHVIADFYEMTRCAAHTPPGAMTAEEFEALRGEKRKKKEAQRDVGFS